MQWLYLIFELILLIRNWLCKYRKYFEIINKNWSCYWILQVNAAPSQDLLDAIKECSPKFGTNPDTFATELVSNDKKCVYKCVQEKVGIMNAEGEFTMDNFKSKHPQATPAETSIHENCVKTSKKAEPCDSALALHQCIVEHMSEHHH